MHPLLKRQLKRIGLDDATAPPSLDGWQQLLERVSQSYLESDQGHELLERSIALSSKEMQELNEQLRRTSESRLAEERDKLQTVLRSIGDGLCVVDRRLEYSCCSIPRANGSGVLPKKRSSGGSCMT